MILATDVYYTPPTAVASGVVIDEWDSTDFIQSILTPIEAIAPYQPGFFYKRELPCLLALLEHVKHPLDAIIVDGYVTLGAEKRAGLGMYLYKAIGRKTPIIGVAKRNFKGTPEQCHLFRRNSLSPLFVTAVGMEVEQAKTHIHSMAGIYRMPTILKMVDQLGRGLL